MTIQFNAAACQLAKCLFLARAEAFQLEVCAWDALEPHAKSMYVQQAQDVLNANRPHVPSLFEDFVRLTRAHAATINSTHDRGMD